MKTNNIPNKNISFYTKFAKVDDDMRMVYGYCTTEALDSQGEIVSRKAIRKAWQAYMEYGNIREMHQPSAVGVTKEYAHDDVGTWIGVKVVDDTAWKKVKEGVYKGFSIGGRVVVKNGKTIEEIILSEISLVDRPANPEAKITVVKVDSDLVQSLQLEAIEKNTMYNFVIIDGVKYREDPENAGQALLEGGEMVLFTDEDQTTLDAAIQAAEDEKAKAEADAKAIEDKRIADEAKAIEEANIAAGLNADGSAKDTAGADAGAEGGAVAATGAEEGADAGKAAGADIKKDTEGVLTMADVLAHVEWAMTYFASEGKDTTSLSVAKDAIMECIQQEASSAADKAFTGGDLSKAFESLSKGMLSKFQDVLKGELAPLAEKVDGLSKEVDQIKGTKVSPRPKTAFAVEKGFDAGAGTGAVGADAIRKELDAKNVEISKFADEMQAILKTNPERQGEMNKKASELYFQYESIKSRLNDSLQA